MCCTPTRPPPTPSPSHSALNKISNFNINQIYLIHAYTLCHNKDKLLTEELRYISSDFPGDIEQYVYKLQYPIEIMK
jgi:hypothetical protein